MARVFTARDHLHKNFTISNFTISIVQGPQGTCSLIPTLVFCYGASLDRHQHGLSSLNVQILCKELGIRGKNEMFERWQVSRVIRAAPAGRRHCLTFPLDQGPAAT